jgi:hypothetical protein
MPKDFTDFQTKQENFSDFNEKKAPVDPNFTLNQATAQEISIPFLPPSNSCI